MIANCRLPIANWTKICSLVLTCQLEPDPEQMKLLKQVLGKQIEFGSEEHTGWLPLDSAVPPPTPVEKVVVDVRILETDGGFIVKWESKDTHHSNDSWHTTLPDAQKYAQDQFGIEATEWENSN
jgi:hypothetical protein